MSDDPATNSPVNQQLGRRRFLKRSALALAAAAGGSLLGCAPSAPAPTAPPAAAPQPTAAPPAKPAATTAPSKPLVKARWVGGSATLDVLFAPWTVAIPLGFYKDEGVDFEFAVLPGGVNTIQALSAGNVEFANVTHATLLPLLKDDKDLGLKVVYTWLRKFHAGIAVMPDSPYKEIKDLKGKKMGVVALGDTGVFAGKAMLREVGLNPDEVEPLVVGYGASAWTALRTGQVDYLSIWDVEFAREENVGAKYRYLPMPPRVASIPGSSVGVSTKYLAANRQTVVGALRGFTKGIVFAQTNPEAAVRLHWKVYPESKPTGKSDEEAVKEALHLLDVRLDKLRADDQPDKRWGFSDPVANETWVDFLGLKGQVKNLDRVWTNELIDDINRGLELDKVRELARTYKP